MLKTLKRNNYLIIYLLIVGVFNLLLLTLPLTNVFGYEFSALNALLISFLSGLFTISFLKSIVKENRKFSIENYLSAFRWMIFFPFAISVINSMIFGFCSFTDGLLFYIVITFPSVVIGSAIGSAIFLSLKKFRILSFVFFYILILFISVLEIYFNPQVYLYNPLFAYFPGTIYDEGLSVNSKLILYRLFNVIFFFTIIFYCIRWAIQGVTSRRIKSFLFLLIIIAGIFYFIISPLLGFSTTESSLDKKLSYQVESKHFILHADNRIEKKVVEQIVLSQEYYYLQNSIFFEEEPSNKIKSFVFIDSEQKQKLFGAGAADVAKPWLNSIFVSADTWESTLKHEIAHCFTAGFGTGIFKLASGFNPSLIEGVAEAADGIYDENSIHYLASLAYENNYRINLNSLFNSFSFFGSVSSLSYIYSGSFIKYLVYYFGIGKVKNYYANGDFNKSFSANLDSVINKYEMFLDTLSDSSTKEKAIYYFGSKPLISKVCPRYIASSVTQAWNYYASKQTIEAENIFENVLSKAESYGAIIGLAKIYEDQDSLSKAIKLIQSNVISFDRTSYEYDLKIRLADLYVKDNEYEKSRELYSYSADAKPNRRLELVSKVRLSLLKINLIKKYVTGSDFDKYQILKEINLKDYNYASIPLMIDLSESLKESYEFFLSNFKNNFEVNDEISSYAVYKLSQYMLQNQDYQTARKMAGISLRYKINPELLFITQNNFNKIDWFTRYAETILQQTKF